MDDETKSCKSFTIFAVLMALSAAAHVSVHLPQAACSSSWLVGVAVFASAMWLLFTPNLKSFLALAALQVVDVVVNAPHNPDHWLLVFFANLIVLASAVKVWRRDHSISKSRLMATLVPGTRLVFVICYAFAAFSKYNSDFLLSEHSAARELLQQQAAATPVLSSLVWSPAVPWTTLACESSIPLLVLFGRTRPFGVLLGVAFHALLVMSPSVCVYDFTFIVYTMLYLMTPNEFEGNLRRWWESRTTHLPFLFRSTYAYLWIPLLCAVLCLVAVSARYRLMEIPPRLLWLRWMVAMAVLCCLAGLCFVGFYHGNRREDSLKLFPGWVFPYAVVGLAIANGICPYVGLKTQGSFTMFSNLRTEGGQWNHLLVPRCVRFVDHYQDRLIQVVASNDPVLNERFVRPELLATEFEIRRRVMENPSLSITTIRNGREVVIEPAVDDQILGTPLGLLPRKLLIFRPVSHDGHPFMSN